MPESKQLMEEAKRIGARGHVINAEAGQSLVEAANALLQSQTFFPSEI
jgi:DNA-binding NarL/FixJ family response regulator